MPSFLLFPKNLTLQGYYVCYSWLKSQWSHQYQLRRADKTKETCPTVATFTTHQPAIPACWLGGFPASTPAPLCKPTDLRDSPFNPQEVQIQIFNPFSTHQEAWFAIRCTLKTTGILDIVFKSTCATSPVQPLRPRHPPTHRVIALNGGNSQLEWWRDRSKRVNHSSGTVRTHAN